MADWPTIVGPAIAAVTMPRRLHGGTLTIACAGPIAMELQHLAREVIERINTHLGRHVWTACASCRTRAALPVPPAGAAATRRCRGGDGGGGPAGRRAARRAGIAGRRVCRPAQILDLVALAER